MKNEIRKKIPPIGIEDFSRMMGGNYYYVDKTLFIKELLDSLASVNVFLRPRRFGKTLALSTLKYFFEDTGDEMRNAANRALFEPLKILQEDVGYAARMTSCPVVSLTLKSAKQLSLNDSLYELKSAVSSEFHRHLPIVEGHIGDSDKTKYSYLSSYESCKSDSAE